MIDCRQAAKVAPLRGPRHGAQTKLPAHSWPELILEQAREAAAICSPAPRTPLASGRPPGSGVAREMCLLAISMAEHAHGFEWPRAEIGARPLLLRGAVPLAARVDAPARRFVSGRAPQVLGPRAPFVMLHLFRSSRIVAVVRAITQVHQVRRATFIKLAINQFAPCSPLTPLRRRIVGRVSCRTDALAPRDHLQSAEKIKGHNHWAPDPIISWPMGEHIGPRQWPSLSAACGSFGKTNTQRPSERVTRLFAHLLRLR